MPEPTLILNKPPRAYKKDTIDVPITNPVLDAPPHHENYDVDVQIDFTNTQVDPSILLP